MTACPYQSLCGGCPLRNMTSDDYRNFKIAKFEHILKALKQTDITVDEPIFVPDGNRRRAEFAFAFRKGKISLGFNTAQSHDIIDIDHCLSLTDKINQILPELKRFLADFCAVKITQKVKNKIQTKTISQGDIWVIEAANGLDILLEIEEPINLEQRMLICDFINAGTAIRFSVQVKNVKPETIVEKARPHINICGHDVFIPAGTFLQASGAGEKALTDTLLRYLGDACGNIADLFCGVGTFSYPLSDNIKNKITAVDSAPDLLESFRKTVNNLTIPNIKILQKNLFKYPLDTTELKEFDIIVFDPPRAGAAAQVKQIAALNTADKPQKIVAISCNPHTFINDANTLIEGGFKLQNITMVDQFVYADHFELVALFEKY
ncbi:MAG: methyltransferase domain-containing protein [Alphaproteobacteria bacterium]